MLKFPTPILKPLWPFATGAVITYGLIWKAADAMQDTPDFINDPRHPRFAKGGKFIDLEKN